MFFVVKNVCDLKAIEASIQSTYGVVGLARVDPQLIKLDTRADATSVLYLEVPDEAADVMKRSLSMDGFDFSCSPLLIHLIE